MDKPSSKKSILMLHLAVMLFGLSGVAAKYIGASALLLTFGRSAVSACLLLFVLLFKKERLRLRSFGDALLLVAAGLVLALHWVAFFQSIKLATVAVGTMTFSTFPLFLTFLEPLFFREKFKKISLVLSVLLLAGVLVMVPEFSIGNDMTLGVLWGTAGSLAYAALSLMNRRLSARYPAAKVCFYEQATAALALLPLVIKAGEIPSAHDAAIIAVVGAVCTAFAFSLFVSAQKNVKAQIAGIVSGMETVYGILFALLLLGAVPGTREIVGGAVIFVAALAAAAKG